jgi:transcription factor SFP1
LPPHITSPQQIHAYVQAQMAIQQQGQYSAGSSAVASTSASSSSYEGSNAASTSQVPYQMNGQLQYPSHDGAVFEADEIEMEMDSPPPPPSHSYSPSPPSSSSSAPSTPVASYAVEHTSLNPQAQQPFSAFDNHHVVSASSNRVFGFRPAASATKLSMHGYPLTAHGMDDEYSHQHKIDMDPQGIVPALLQGGSAPTTRVGTPMSSQARRHPQGHSISQPPSPHAISSKAHSSHSGSAAAAIARSASTTLSRPAASLLIPKPFRCPKPNCSKSYKQANGLKYHMTHGSCSFAPARDIEEVQALLASKRLAAAGSSSASAPTSPLDDNSVESLNASMAALSEADLRDLSIEAERRLRPFACGVGQCTRRYKNMNGLRYHYSHSGEHGAIGLALLASGQHECLRQNNGHSRYAASRERSMASATATPASASMSPSGRGTPMTENGDGSDVSTPTTPMQQQYPYPQSQRSPSLSLQPQSPYETHMQAYSQQQQAMPSHMQDQQQQQMAYMQQQYAQQQQYATAQQQPHMYGSMSP